MKIPDSEELLQVRKHLVQWFEQQGRPLPWRGTRDPYAIWVSEIMLQQTTTKTVSGYYDRFLKAYPTVSDLAAAPLSDVLHLWEGLGYYRRARQLHLAAQKIQSEYNGLFPETLKQVLDLPGIGRYTAGAICSIAYDHRVPILEANTIRLHARLLGLELETGTGRGNSILWDFAEKILPRKKCGQFNQALMDFGALVCTPSDPDCGHCRLVRWCEAGRNGLQNSIPVLKKKVEKEARVEVAFLVTRQGTKGSEYLIFRYPDGGRWARLWDFPRLLQESDRKPSDDRELARLLHSLPECGTLHIGPILQTIHHCVTRYNITLLVCETKPGNESPAKFGEENVNTETTVTLAAGHYLKKDLEYRWVTAEELTNTALNSTARRVAKSNCYTINH